MDFVTRRSHAAINASPTRERRRAWRRSRPLVGGVLVALGGLEMFLSSQLDLGNIHIQLGIEGMQATIIPIVLVLLGALIIAMPVHRIFYGVIALAVAMYSLVGVNLGGFLLGMLLSTVGGILAVSWMPPVSESDADPEVLVEADAGDEPAVATLADDVSTRPATGATG